MMSDHEILIRPAAEADIRDFATWRHEPPYDIYDVNGPVESEVAYFLSDSVNCHVIEIDGQLGGFITFGSDAQVSGGDYSQAALDIGMGMKPSLTGQGNGHRFVAAVVGFTKAQFDVGLLRVSVAVGNQRAAAVWRHAGFTEVHRFDSEGKPVMGSATFVVMTLPV